MRSLTHCSPCRLSPKLRSMHMRLVGAFDVLCSVTPLSADTGLLDLWQSQHHPNAFTPHTPQHHPNDFTPHTWRARGRWGPLALMWRAMADACLLRLPKSGRSITAAPPDCSITAAPPGRTPSILHCLYLMPATARRPAHRVHRRQPPPPPPRPTWTRQTQTMTPPGDLMRSACDGNFLRSTPPPPPPPPTRAPYGRNSYAWGSGVQAACGLGAANDQPVSAQNHSVDCPLYVFQRMTK